nr:WHG domain-containing protein [Arthrobacter nitrophenolicus]
MDPLIGAVSAAQAAGTLRPAPAELVAVAIWAQVHGLMSLELDQMGPPDAPWEDVYRLALDAIGRGWAA